MRSLAEHLDLPIGFVRRAVENGDITVIPFAGQKVIPPSEAERISELFGLKARDPGAIKGNGQHGLDHKDQEQERQR